MHPFRFESGSARPTILFLGAHCDDIEIGCGGTVMELCERLPEARIHWLVMSSNADRKAETLAAARRLMGESRVEDVVVETFRDGFLPYEGTAVKECFEATKQRVSPDLIFTHYRHDLHQDHRLVNELTWNTWRDHAILEYEIPKWDGDLGQPNTYVPLTEARVEAKADIILECFPSQASKAWLDRDTLRALPRLRGMEANAPDRFAEAFYGRKLSIGF